MLTPRDQPTIFPFPLPQNYSLHTHVHTSPPFPCQFGQLTLRRPRRSSLGATDMTDLLDEQQDNGDHHSPAHGNLNGQSPADKSKAISSSNGSANCHLDQRQANGGDGSRNPSSSVASSTQPNSPGSSSLESSSVVKFRALLLSPAGSQEDLAADLPPPTPISIFRKPNLPAARNGGPLLMPPSPFSRKNSTNTKDGNNGQQQDCFGDGELRRSLRSPTMRRLQDSLQSLATVDGHGGGEGTSGGESRGGTPKPFNCRSSQYRSFNLRRETARQKQILEHLATVRAQLKNSQAQLECTISKQNLAATEADGDVHL